MLVVLAIVPPLFALRAWTVLRTSPMLFGRIPIIDSFDIDNYYHWSRWATGVGRLYREVPAEYPLLANLLFAGARFVARALPLHGPAIATFEFVWVTSGWWGWLAVGYVLYQRAPRAALWLWLTPSALYFSLFRFDVWPVGATLLALLAARDGRTLRSSLWGGVAIGLKGYPLLFLPVFLVWVVSQRGIRHAAWAAVLALAPLLLSLGAVYLMSGARAVAYPFQFQGVKWTNGEGLYDALSYLTGRHVGGAVHAVAPWLPSLLILACAAAAALMRPRSVEDLCRAYVVAVGGYLVFTAFNSPQYALWLVPAAALANDRPLLFLATCLQWATFGYYPLAFFGKAKAAGAFRASVTLSAAARIAVFGRAVVPRERVHERPL